MRWRRRWAVLRDAAEVEFSLLRRRLADRRLLFWSLRVVLVLALLLLVGFLVADRFSDPSALLESVRAAGAWGPVLVVFLIILEVVFAPLPGTFVMVASGALFGMWLGALYSYVGNVAGSLIAFYLARRFGRGLVRRLVSRRLLDRYDSFFSRHRDVLVVLYALPVVPVDILSFVSGLSSLRFRRFLLVVSIGFVPNTLILSFLGERLASLSFLGLLLYGLLFVAVFSLLAWLFRQLARRAPKKTI